MPTLLALPSMLARNAETHKTGVLELNVQKKHSHRCFTRASILGYSILAAATPCVT